MENNTRFHHSYKGCHLEPFIKIREGRPVLLFACLTHLVTCGRSGWELGWCYGTNSKEIFKLGDYKFICKICGKEYSTNKPTKCYCENCQNLRMVQPKNKPEQQ